MGRLLAVFALVGMACVAPSSVNAADYESVILDFEDLWDGGTEHGTVPDPYANLYWPHTAWLTKDSQPNTGYYYTIEGDVGIYSWSTMVMRSLKGPFSLLTARLGAAFMDGMLVHVEAYRDHQRIYDFWMTVSAYGGNHTLNICNVDVVRFNPYIGSGTPAFPPEEGRAIVADNMEIVYGEIPAPVADAGPDQTVEQTSGTGAEVALDGSGSDPCVSYVWSLNGTQLATGEIVTVTLPPGGSSVQLTVTDELGLQGTDECVVTVQDTTPPDGLLTILQEQLVPPRGKNKLVLAAVVSEVSDACDPQPTVTLHVASDEPLDDPAGPAKHPDYLIIETEGAWEIWLRAESDDRTPREYYVSATLADNVGNTALLGPETITVARGKPGKGPKPKR